MLKKSKIVATIGPASNSSEIIKQLMDSGMNVARLNFSHGSHEEHQKVIEIIRKLDINNQIGILQDIAGPKIRIGEIENDQVFLRRGEEFFLTEQQILGNARQVTVNLAGFSRFVHAGDRILLNDGLVELKVSQVESGNVKCRIENEGYISSRKGISLPTSSSGLELLSEKDKADIKFGIAAGVDFMAISFVRNGRDIREVKEFITSQGGNIPLIAKIEKPEALDNIEDILAESAGIMIARGDLGVEVAFERIPTIQKNLIKLANKACKPVITATQMLVSMVENPRPTRAEVTDVANAILDGSDAVMLSEETAIGKNPVLAVSTMTRLAIEVEKNLNQNYDFNALSENETLSADLNVADNACRLAYRTNSRAIVCFTMSGSTARKVCRFRPRVEVIALSQVEKTCRELSLSWGINPIQIAAANSLLDVIKIAKEELLAAKIAEPKERFVVTCGIPFNVIGNTNLSGVFEV
ncbi:MAG: pyruvate kinase [Candidatus Cloacimonetes bacterium]|nr:pyruvate kinase [Candidatus Cloacimonadota bacterium]